MKPGEVGFDGAIGLKVGDVSGELIYRLKRGKSTPDIDKYDFRNQLLWYHPDNQDSKLLFCSDDNSLYELDFVPVEPWSLSSDSSIENRD